METGTSKNDDFAATGGTKPGQLWTPDFRSPGFSLPAFVLRSSFCVLHCFPHWLAAVCVTAVAGVPLATGTVAALTPNAAETSSRSSAWCAFTLPTAGLAL